MAILKAIGVNEQGTREILGISCSFSEAEVQWRKFSEDMLLRGINGMKLVISDDDKDLRAMLRSCLSSFPWQRCIFHLCQNAQHYSPTLGMRGEIFQAVRGIYQAIDLKEARMRMKERVNHYQGKAKRFCDWLESNFEEVLAFYKFSRGSSKQIRTVNMVENLNKEVRRRTNVVRVFPSEESCLRLVRAVPAGKHEE